MDEELITIFNKWGTYRSLQKDAEIVKYFIKRPEQDIRQKTIIEKFKGKMAPITVRKHLYNLVEKGILEENPQYPGTYAFVPYHYRRMGIDMDRLVKTIVGQDIYDIAVTIWKEKHLPKEPGTSNHRDSIEDEIEREAKQIETELNEYVKDYY